MFIKIRSRIIVGQFLVLCALGACLPSVGARASGGSGGSGPTVTEQLTGPAINGVVPQGQARADESQFPSGGSTIITYSVKNVNLPDGTVLSVTLDFGPEGTIMLSRGQGTLVVNEGHFAVSHDVTRVYNGDTQILIGGFFK